LRIPRSLLDEIVAQARAEAPNECCGIVGSRDGEAVRLFKARNARASPFAYEIHPGDLQEIMERLDEEGLEIGVIYHSHTRTDPEPSQTDLNLANPLFGSPVYLIVGVKDPARDDVRGWRIAKTESEGAPQSVEVSEEPLEIYEA
jgi:[CysO sulfur-carrier protein]-S-L-cysteine hydrolase